MELFENSKLPSGRRHKKPIKRAILILLVFGHSSVTLFGLDKQCNNNP